MNKKKILSYLTALSLLASIVPSVKAVDKSAEGNYIVVNETNNQNYNYELLKIKSIFNMTEEEANKKENAMYTSLFNVLFDDFSTIYIPCIERENLIIKDEEKELGNNPEILKRGSGVLISSLSSLFDEESYNAIKDRETVYIYRSLIDDAIVGAMFVDLTESFPSKKYFDDLQPGLVVADSEVFIFRQYISYILSKRSDLSREEKEKIVEETDTEVSLLDYRERFYKSVVSIYNWPVLIKKEITNESLPVFEEDFLNMNIEDIPNLMIFEIVDGFGKSKFLLARFDSLEWCYFDFFTNAKLGTSDDFEKRIKSTYGSQVFPKTITGAFINFSKLEGSLTISGQRQNEILYEFVEDVQNNPTVRGLIDSYIRLPKGYTFDYSYFDFTNNPNVVQPDKSSVIVNPKGNFIANLDNMILTPIVNKPKLKELTRNS